MIPFPHKFDNPDIHLSSTLTSPSELQGLLQRAVTALRNVLDRRAFDIPASVQAATAAFRAEADPLRAFMEERIKSKRSGGIVLRHDVFSAYVLWATQNGYQPLSSQRFYEQFLMAAVEGLRYPVVMYRREHGRYFSGVELVNY